MLHIQKWRTDKIRVGWTRIMVYWSNGRGTLHSPFYNFLLCIFKSHTLREQWFNSYLANNYFCFSMLALLSMNSNMQSKQLDSWYACCFFYEHFCFINKLHVASVILWVTFFLGVGGLLSYFAFFILWCLTLDEINPID